MGSDQGCAVAGLLGAVLAGEALLGGGDLVVLVRGQVVDPLLAAVALDRGPLRAGEAGHGSVGPQVVVAAVVAVPDVLASVAGLPGVLVVSVGRVVLGLRARLDLAEPD